MTRALMLVCALMALACTREFLDQEGLADPDLSGSVRIPLSTESGGSGGAGATYFLRDATLEVSGSVLLTLSSNGKRADALSTPLPAGRYSVFLRPGFRIVEVDDAGHERAVEARLVGPNPLRFSLREVEDATLKLTFDHAGTPLVFGGAPAVRVSRAAP